MSEKTVFLQLQFIKEQSAMSNSFFNFRKFSVLQEKCAAKVGTDSVLLGAWADVSLSDDSVCNVLDVGTGTGVIALMVAQRSSHAMIDAIDIDRDAYMQATENVENSIFRDRIRVIQQSFFDFSTAKKYDLIISNPPFFKNALLSPDNKRNTARHNDCLPLKEMIEHAIPLLSENGRIALILPLLLSEELDFIIATHHLFERRRTDVITIEGAQPKRFLIEITPINPHKQDPLFNKTADTLILETKDHKRTEQYLSLTNEFYLNPISPIR